MANTTDTDTGARLGRWRLIPWLGAGALLLAPLVAMRFTEAVRWTASDFALMAALLAAPLGLFQLISRRSPDRAFRGGLAVALGTAFLLVWTNLAVGLIGDGSHPANLMFAAVLAVGLLGAMLSRLRAAGMAQTLAVMAATQALAGLWAWAAKLDQILPPTAVFTALWLGAAGLFALAARRAAT